MSRELAKSTFVISKAIQDDVNQIWLPPADGLRSSMEKVLAMSLVKGTKVYIESVVNQINSAYETACYDACAVMIRRLVETLIIEAFEHNDIADTIKTPAGDFFYLRELITYTLNEKKWNLGRNTRQALPKLKNIGDLSAHSRRHLAHRSDIDNIIPDLRIAAQELIHLANFK
jgi:hypothetical protein